jgi:hypothetical protein
MCCESRKSKSLEVGKFTTTNESARRDCLNIRRSQFSQAQHFRLRELYQQAPDTELIMGSLWNCSTTGGKYICAALDGVKSIHMSVSRLR